MPPQRTTSDLQSGSPSQLSKRTNGGKNQYNTNCPPSDDPKTQKALLTYQRRGITNPKAIAKLLKEDHDIEMSPATVKRRRAGLELKAARGVKKDLSDWNKEYLIESQIEKFKQLGKDVGPRTIKKAIAEETGMILSRDFIAEYMKDRDPLSALRRRPISAVQDSAWIVEYFNPDGIPRIHAMVVRDFWSRRVLAWTLIPRGLLREAFCTAVLQAIHRLGGMPVQSADCCKWMSAFVKSCEKALAPGAPELELGGRSLAEHIRLANGSRPWYDIADGEFDDEFETRLRDCSLEMLYGEKIRDLREDFLSQWLALPLTRTKIDLWFKEYNARLPKFKRRVGPLQLVDRAAVQQVMTHIGGEELMLWPTPKYDREARRKLGEVMGGMRLEDVTEENTRRVFAAMRPHAWSLYIYAESG